MLQQRYSRIALAALALFASIQPSLAQDTEKGCYTQNIGGITFHNGSSIYNSHGYCESACTAANMPVMALQQYDCWCGTTLPPSSGTVSESMCSQTCPAWTPDDCGGGTTYYSILLTGLPGVKQGSDSETNKQPQPQPHSKPAPAPAPEPHTSKARPPPVHRPQPTTTPTVHTSVIIKPGKTYTQTVMPIGSESSSTPTPSSTSSSDSSSSGPSKAGIAAGVVVGLVALAAIVGGLYLFLRRRKNKQLEAAHRRQSSINALAGAQRHPHMSVLQDSRLDPVIAARRQSDGSIADNQDFSRRVLKVTNPDDRW